MAAHAASVGSGWPAASSLVGGALTSMLWVVLLWLFCLVAWRTWGLRSCAATGPHVGALERMGEQARAFCARLKWWSNGTLTGRPAIRQGASRRSTSWTCCGAR